MNTTFSLPPSWQKAINTRLEPETYDKIVNVTTEVVKTGFKVSLCAGYLAAGLSLITLGGVSSVYTLHKTYQFYFETPPEPQTGYSIPFLSSYFSTSSSTTSEPSGLGYGPTFKKYCDKAAQSLNLASGDAICSDLSTKGWKELNQPESTAAAVGTTLLVGGSTLMLSSYSIISGLSLLGRSFQTFLSLVQKDPKEI